MILLMFYLDHTGAGQSLGEKKNKKIKKIIILLYINETVILIN
jgi:hypothetical protein